MTLPEYVRRMAKAVKKLRETKTERAVGVAGDVMAQVKRRLQTKGEDADGASFVAYSKLYAAERARKGFQTGFVDFTRSGRMLNSINPSVERDGRFNTIVVLKAGNKEDADKLKGQATRADGTELRGNILRPSKKELAFAIKIWRERALKIINEIA